MDDFFTDDLGSPINAFQRIKKISYVRPDFSAIVSPRESDTFSMDGLERERRARKRLRGLLEEQANINEVLYDENETLEYQQKSLLQLLLAKDRQIDTMVTTASLNSTLEDAECKGGDQEMLTVVTMCQSLSRVMRGKVERETQYALAVWKQAAYQGKISQLIEKTNQYTRGRAALAMALLLRNMFVQKEESSFSKLRTYMGSSNRQDAVLTITRSLSRLSLIMTSNAFSKIRIFSTFKRSALRFMKFLYRKQLQDMFKEWRLALIDPETNENNAEVERIRNVTRQFLVLNALVNICSKWEYGQRLNSILRWRGVRKWGNETQEKAAVLLLRALRGPLKRCMQMFSLRNTATIRPMLAILNRCIAARSRQAITKISLAAQSTLTSMAEDNAELANFNSKLAQQMNDVSAAKDKHINDLKTRLDNTTKECKKLAKQLAINGHQIDEFQKKKEYERETYSAQNLGITKDLRIAQATLKDLRDKVEASEEQTKMIYLQNSTLKEKLSSSKGNLKRSQELYAHSMHEKSKVTVNENEYKKQLISMTSTIDSLAEDKDGLLTKLKGLGQDIADVRDQLNYQTEANKKLSLQANEAISLHMEKENILEDKIHTLEQEANKVPRDANLNISPEAMNLKETNRRLRQQVVDLEGKLASQKRRISSERNREIQENKAEAEYQLIQLNSELNGLQETISYQSITNGKLNTQNKELRTNVSQAKKEAQRLATERGALMTNVHEQQNICKAQSEEQVQELLSKNQTLERELVNIQGYVMQGRNTNVELQRVLEDKRRAEAELAEVAGAMEECRREAVNSKSEVQRVCAEMDNYAQILEAMEGKVNEAEDKVNHAERVREEAIGEIHAIRQRYINALK